MKISISHSDKHFRFVDIFVLHKKLCRIFNNLQVLFRLLINNEHKKKANFLAINEIEAARVGRQKPSDLERNQLRFVFFFLQMKTLIDMESLFFVDQ